MMMVDRKTVKKMRYQERLSHYETEKREILTDASLTSAEIVLALESLREKWLI